jgi:hypothetical protein
MDSPFELLGLTFYADDSFRAGQLGKKRSLFIPHRTSMATKVPPRDLECTPCRHPCGTENTAEQP